MAIIFRDANSPGIWGMAICHSSGIWEIKFPGFWVQGILGNFVQNFVLDLKSI